MQNIVIDMCEKFHNDRLRNDRALVLWKSDNNDQPKKNNVGSAWGPVSGYKNVWLNNPISPSFPYSLPFLRIRAAKWRECVYVLQSVFFVFCRFFPSATKYETTVLGNGWTDFHETVITKR